MAKINMTEAEWNILVAPVSIASTFLTLYKDENNEVHKSFVDKVEKARKLLVENGWEGMLDKNAAV